MPTASSVSASNEVAVRSVVAFTSMQSGQRNASLPPNVPQAQQNVPCMLPAHVPSPVPPTPAGFHFQALCSQWVTSPKFFSCSIKENGPIFLLGCDYQVCLWMLGIGFHQQHPVLPLTPNRMYACCHLLLVLNGLCSFRIAGAAHHTA